MPCLVDTDWAIQALRGDLDAASVLRQITPLRPSISWVTLAELNEQAYRTPNPPASLQGLARFLIAYRIRYPNDAIAERFAEIRAYLRSRGQRIPDFDIVIAATALHFNLTLLTFDANHFNRVPDLRLYQM
jgi:predicted nucleic acid-binding protein